MKFQKLKVELKEWNNQRFSNIQGRVEAAKANLESIQSRLQSTPTGVNRARAAVNTQH